MKSFYIFNETDENFDVEIKTLKKLLKFGLRKEKLKNVEFNTIFVDRKKRHEINKEYRNVDRETDVISFALEDDKTFNTDAFRFLGDIYISIEKAKEQAIEYGHSLKREIAFLSVHGFLHLLGYDHMAKEDEETMFNLQEEILDSYGIKRS